MDKAQRTATIPIRGEALLRHMRVFTAFGATGMHKSSFSDSFQFRDVTMVTVLPFVL